MVGATSRASRAAVCIGTENPTLSAHAPSAGSHISTERSRQRTSWPRARNAPAGPATEPG